jgi:hypothetical protein
MNVRNITMGAFDASGGLEIVEDTYGRLVIIEGPSLLGVVPLALGTALMTLAIRSQVPARALLLLLVTILCLPLLLAVGLAFTKSRISIEVRDSCIRIDRRLLFFTVHKRYAIADVKEAFVWGSNFRGTALKLRLTSGRVKDLSLRTEYFELEPIAEKLNNLIRSSKARS